MVGLTNKELADIDLKVKKQPLVHTSSEKWSYKGKRLSKEKLRVKRLKR